jgi:hypothetical protein
MNMSEQDKTDLQTRIKHYGVYFALMLFIGSLLFWGEGDSAGVVLVKMMAVPLWGFALHGLNFSLGQPLRDGKFSLAALEYLILFGVIMASVLTIFGWRAEFSGIRIIGQFAYAFVIWVALQSALLVWNARGKRITSLKNKQP